MSFNAEQSAVWIIQDKSMVVHQPKAETTKHNYIKYGALQTTAFQEQ